MGRSFTVTICGHQIRLRRQEFKPNHARQCTTGVEERDRNKLEDRDTLTNSGQKPTHQTVLTGRIVPPGHLGRRWIEYSQNGCAHRTGHPAERKFGESQAVSAAGSVATLVQ